MADSTLYRPIMEALLARLQTKCGDTFQTYSRRFVMWENMAQMVMNGKAPVQPALYLFDGVMMTGGGRINFERTAKSVPNKRLIERTIVIYAQMPGGGTPDGTDSETPGGDVFYPLQEAVEAAIEPDPGDSWGALTLGGLCEHCWIQGDGYMFTGDIDPNGQGMLTIPVRILVP